MSNKPIWSFQDFLTAVSDVALLANTSAIMILRHYFRDQLVMLLKRHADTFTESITLFGRAPQEQGAPAATSVSSPTAILAAATGPGPSSTGFSSATVRELAKDLVEFLIDGDEDLTEKRDQLVGSVTTVLRFRLPREFVTAPLPPPPPPSAPTASEPSPAISTPATSPLQPIGRVTFDELRATPAAAEIQSSSLAMPARAPPGPQSAEVAALVELNAGQSYRGVMDDLNAANQELANQAAATAATAPPGTPPHVVETFCILFSYTWHYAFLKVLLSTGEMVYLSITPGSVVLDLVDHAIREVMANVDRIGRHMPNVAANKNNWMRKLAYPKTPTCEVHLPEVGRLSKFMEVHRLGHPGYNFQLLPPGDVLFGLRIFEFTQLEWPMESTTRLNLAKAWAKANVNERQYQKLVDRVYLYYFNGTNRVKGDLPHRHTQAVFIAQDENVDEDVSPVVTIEDNAEVILIREDDEGEQYLSSEEADPKEVNEQ